ncbi:MAG: ATP-dependent zinc metalloprotease FtsH [Candidatus Eisenbacteria bacterium]|nr:ATP-dependent zinc metalloprotease FtsH [Candidatus Eisenbacteria bacterium]
MDGSPWRIPPSALLSDEPRESDQDASPPDEDPPGRRPAGQRPARGSGRRRTNRPRLGGGPGPGGPGPVRSFRTLSLWLLAALAVFVVVQWIFSSQQAGTEISYDAFWRAVEDQRVTEVTIMQRQVQGEYRQTEGGELERFNTYLPSDDNPELIQMLRRQGVKIESKPEPTPWFSVLLTWLPFLVLLGLFFLLIRQMQAGGSAALKFGKSRAKLLHENRVRVTFGDVAGAVEAKQELQEVIEFLRDPRKFRRLGGRIPKGVLLVGPPGTGKTLLARAVAGEAKVPFYSISGSDFVEMFVGVGAARVRDLFEQGKRNAPCIIFVDELDAVGRHRGAGLGGGHDEREQTLNALLVEMDGFDANEGVILLSATNRPDVLDPALLRPGRFDRTVVVDRPDVRGREGILKVHVRNKPLSKNVDLRVLARGTPGLAGADLENIVNEAALLAARKDQQVITMADLEEAKDKVMMGTERRSLIISQEEKKITAYHESGHALVGWFLPDTDPVHKVTVIPRGRALGLTHRLPVDDRHLYSREYIEQTMATMMGGRAAEQIVFGRITSGAGSDIDVATELARKMVCEWGMSDRLGPVQYGKHDELVFLGREISHQKDYSEQTAQLIDEEVQRIVSSAYQKAHEILTEHRDKLHALAEALLKHEVLDGDQVDCLLQGKSLDDPDCGRHHHPEEQSAAETSDPSAGEARATEPRAGETQADAPESGEDDPAAKDPPPAAPES